MQHPCLLSTPIDKTLSEAQLIELRTLYKASDPDRRKIITEQVNQLKIGRICYQCKRCPFVPEFLPFCTKECHEAWAALYYSNYPQKQRPSLQEIKQRELNEKKKSYLK